MIELTTTQFNEILNYFCGIHIPEYSKLSSICLKAENSYLNVLSRTDQIDCVGTSRYIIIQSCTLGYSLLDETRSPLLTMPIGNGFHHLESGLLAGTISIK